MDLAATIWHNSTCSVTCWHYLAKGTVTISRTRSWALYQLLHSTLGHQVATKPTHIAPYIIPLGGIQLFSRLSHHLCSVPGRRRTCGSNLCQGPNHGQVHADISRSSPCDFLVSSRVDQTRESEPFHLRFGFIMKTTFALLLVDQSLVNRIKAPHFLQYCVRLWF